MSLSGAALAADNCQVHAGHAQLDYGAQYRQSILGQPASALGYSLGKRLVSVNVVCKEPVRMAIFLRGNALNERAFRFGSQGILSVVTGDANLDGRPVALGSVEHAGQQLSEQAGKVSLHPRTGVVVLEQGVPATGSRLALQLELDPVIPRTSIEVLNNESLWSSSHIMELVPF
ncbi:hypothetical protein [Burkholderia sp. Bp8963]|uniref:hypothetical protein n=1 Tax=Burkholderia sp. Bp8963 TaxID=2184547 RepID=UPI000F5B4992|nr:hypothetical protein [Burkholderia sp. Bp8963]